MFHLYDKVYLDFDHNISAYEPRVVISGSYGADDQTQGFATQHAFGQAPGDIIGEGKTFASELEFFKQIKTLANGSRLIVYCDKPALQHLFIAWHKILLSVTGPTNVWNSWKFFVDKESYRSAVTNTVSHVQYEDIKVSNWSQEEFINKFNSISVTKDSTWLQSILNHLGIEYLLSSYVNGSTSVKPALEGKIKLLAKRTLQGELYDAKLNLISNAYNKTLHNELMIDCPDSIADLLSKPSLSIFKDPEVWNEGYQLVPSDTHGSANISALSGEKLTAMIAAFKLVRETFQKTQSDSSFVKKINWLNWVNSESMTEAELEAVLNSTEFSACELVDEVDHDKVNILLVDWIVMLYKTSSLNSISDLTISI